MDPLTEQNISVFYVFNDIVSCPAIFHCSQSPLIQLNVKPLCCLDTRYVDFQLQCDNGD